MFIKKDVYPQLYPPYRGTIVSADDATSVSGVTISNLTRKQKTSSDRKGNFSILFGPNDSIEFRLSGWETKMVLSSALGDSIFLTKRSIELQEVVVVHDRVSSRLENLKGINRARNKRKGIYYQGRPPITLLSPFGGKPLTFFYELLSKNGRNAREMSRLIAFEIEREKVNNFFNAKLIQSVTSIRDDDLIEFMEKYHPTAEQVQPWTMYDAQVYIKKCYQTFLNSRQQ